MLRDPLRRSRVGGTGNLHDVTVDDGVVVGYGLADAPMIHSADGGGTDARTFGGLEVRLSPARSSP